MASTATGRRLTAQHRQLQLALRAATLRDFLVIWQAFDINNIAGTWPSVETGLVALIQARGATSAGLAANYYQLFREAEGIAGVAPIRLASPPEAASISGSLRIVGPARAGRLVARGVKDAADRTLTSVAGSVGRETLLAGRETLMRSIKADRRARGYQRVTSGNSCAYCAERAGTIQTDETTFPAHDHCACSAEPAFR